MRNDEPAASESPRRTSARTGSVPPEPHSFVAEINPAFEQQIFDLPQWTYIITARRINSGELLK
jgi:hypothetical protein